MKNPLQIHQNKMEMLNVKIAQFLTVFGLFSLMLVYLFSFGLKQSTTSSTQKIAMSLVPSPTQLLLKSAIRRNRTSQNFTPLVVRLMSMTIHPSAKSYPLELLKAFLLGMQRHKRLFGSIFPRREALFVLSMLNAM